MSGLVVQMSRIEQSNEHIYVKERDQLVLVPEPIHDLKCNQASAFTWR